MNNAEIMALEEQYQLKTYAKMPLAITRGEGIFVYDADGRRYYDFYGGHAVALTGHCHPKVVRAIQEQAARLLFYSNVVYNDMRALYSRKLAQAAPAACEQAFFCNSGTEANETALKIARRFTGKNEVIAMTEGFHGRTIGSLSVTGLGNYRKQVSPLLPGIRFAPFGDLAALEAHCNHETAAIILEPILSMAGIQVAEPAFYRGLRQLCDERGIVLIFDEVQTGFGRTGALFAGEHWGVTPDLITAAKGIASGFPMGAVLVSKPIATTIGYGEQGTTFGGGPLACAAALATLEVILEEHLPAHAAEMGAYLRKQTAGMAGLVAVRGLGLLLGVETKPPAKVVQAELFERGFLTGTSANSHVLRLMPPLTVQPTHIDALVRALGEVLKDKG